jgi:hypothetical protein
MDDITAGGMKLDENNFNNQSPLTKPMTFGDWIKTLLLQLIPVVNIILLFIWAFGNNVNINKKNFSRAYLLFMAIGIVIYIIIFVLILSTGSGLVPGTY